MRIALSALLFVVIATTLPACSSQQLYGTGQGWQKNECNKLVDMEQRNRCMNNAKVPYDEYKRDVDAAKGGNASPTR